MKEGDVVYGRVKSITDYGVFIDLGGIDGLLHITDISWGRIGHPADRFEFGDEVKVKVLKFDREKEKIALGMKQLTPDPWENIFSKISSRCSYQRPGD
ncbi:MAG: 30S ribosomal protein S1 [Candidatus Methanoperedenaceae archaeon GB50]|nr:MAG: 30S ribosomal protein S1 [Candidatus Methanoperedenaceae archaeon GB50]